MAKVSGEFIVLNTRTWNGRGLPIEPILDEIIQ